MQIPCPPSAGVNSGYLGYGSVATAAASGRIVSFAVNNGARYAYAMIKSFAQRETELVWQGTVSRRLPPMIQRVARRKLRMLNNAQNLGDLRIPPNNRLEALRGGRKGQHSIRINDQWRLCFRWVGGNAHDVEIVDYHR